MSVVLGSYDGEAIRDYADAMASGRLRDADTRLERNIEMFLMHRKGVPAPKIAKKFRLSVGYVYQEIRAVPQWQKERALVLGLRLG